MHNLANWFHSLIGKIATHLCIERPLKLPFPLCSKVLFSNLGFCCYCACPVFPVQVVVGGAVFDLTAKVTSSRILCEGTNRGVLQTSLGGVGRNLAEVLARLGLHPWLITAVGKDDQGQKILQHMMELGMVRLGCEIGGRA